MSIIRPQAWVQTIAPEDATGELAAAYGWQAKSLGEVTEYTQLGSLHPDLVLLRLQTYKTVEASIQGLTPLEQKLVVYVTSTLNQTTHCASGAQLGLEALGADPAVVAKAVANPFDAQTGDERLDAVLHYTAVLAARPGDTTEADIQRLRAAGLSDGDVVALNNLVAYYAYTNRVATGLGLRTPIPERHALKAVPK
ncbi:MAG: peroxidase-related enzyme [Bifidobacteriaceae bacterium]|nr:peroxidase-related enzyme [Bifidobacteriaceae bacterium]